MLIGCFIVEHHLSRFIEGQDPRNTELIWDQMYRSTVNYGRKGLTIQAISAVDLALWDLLGHIRSEPVYALLGGKTKERLPVYCTTARPDLALAAGFAGAKVPLPHGPADGDRGLRKNIEFIRGWRDQVGPDFPLAVDCYMSLTVPYTIRLANELAPYGIKWLEEYLHPDDYDGYRRVTETLKTAGSSLMLSAGEHEYTRYGFRQLIDHIDIVQPDVTWMGGLTEARRVVAMAAANDRLVIPHGSSVYSYHLQYAFTNCPVAEYINLSPQADTTVPYFGDLFFDEPLPSDGFIDLPPSKPGFGLTLDMSKLRRPYERTDECSRKQAEKNITGNKEACEATLPF
jgi:L-rhamnonate dehydratase